MRLIEGIKDRLFGAAIKKAALERVKGVVRQLKENWEADREKEDYTWRRISGLTDRDLNPVKHERMLKVVLHMYRMNPLAKRQIELMKDYTIGKGIKYTAKSDRVKKVLDRFWNDPVNAWDLKQHSRIRELSLYGEQCYPVSVNTKNGHVRVGNLPPEWIRKVVPDAENPEKLDTVVRRGYNDTGQRTVAQEDRKLQYKVINIDEDPNSKTFNKRVGEAFFFRLNSVSNSTRGDSDLLPNIDWLDAYDRFLFTSLERGEFLRYLIFHLKLTNASEEQIVAKTAEFEHNQPRPGSTYVSGEDETLTPVTPTLGNADTADGAKLFKAMVVAGAGFGFHFFGEGENVNRASAKEMAGPVIKMIEARQTYVRFMVGHMFDFVIDQAIIAGRLSEEDDRSYEVILPDPSPVEAEALAQALKTAGEALALGEEAKLISLDQAQEIYRHIVAQYGLEVKSPELEKDKIEQEEDEEEGKDYKDVEESKRVKASGKGKDLPKARAAVGGKGPI